MDQITARVVEASESPSGVRLTTFALTMPKWLLQEFNTHRAISKSSASSRAIPTRRLLRKALRGYMPAPFTQARPGMASNSPVPPVHAVLASIAWRVARFFSVMCCWVLNLLGVSKQHANRLLEPFLYVSTVATGTDWDNFFSLRDHPDAQPEIQILARKMRAAMSETRYWIRTHENDLHLPFVRANERMILEDQPMLAAALSAARCARVSYANHEGKEPDYVQDLKTALRLLSSKPLHASPWEHQASPLKDCLTRCRNFQGWRQVRADLEDYPLARTWLMERLTSETSSAGRG